VENPTKRINKPDTNDFAVRWGTATLEPNALVKFFFSGVQEPLILKLTQRMVFGRVKGIELPKVDVDLTTYHGAELGVSRVHAAFEIVGKNLMLTDLNSSNGTFLNGQRLAPYQRRIVRDSDEVRLAELHMYISFL
jgi:hypothetical protein